MIKYKIKKKPVKTHPFLYKIFYIDKAGKNHSKIKSRLLKSHKYGLRGKPDIIFRHIITGSLLPMELKSSKIANSTAPHYGDFMQLVTYFILIEESFLARPKKGILAYSDYMFVIKNTKALRNQLLKVVDDMRQMLSTGEGMANPSFVNCRYCIAKNSVCTYKFIGKH